MRCSYCTVRVAGFAVQLHAWLQTMAAHEAAACGRQPRAPHRAPVREIDARALPRRAEQTGLARTSRLHTHTVTPFDSFTITRFYVLSAV